MIYVRWEPDELAIGLMGQTPRVREPPRVVVNDRGQLCAIGLEATETGVKPGYSLIRFQSFGDVQRHAVAAARLLYYITVLIWSERRGFWWRLGATFGAMPRPSMVIHFTRGADKDISVEAAAPLIRELQELGVRQVFLWHGDERGAYAPPRGVPARGGRPGRAPRHDQQNLNAGVLGGIIFTLFQIWAGRVITPALVVAIICAAWAVVECAKRIKLRRHNGLRGPLSLGAMLTRARADLGNNFLIVAPLGAAALAAMGGIRAGERGALIGAIGGLLYVVCMALVERYPVTDQP